MPIGQALGQTKLSDRGYFLVIHNVSDLLATGAKPLAIVIALGLPKNMHNEELLELLKGIKAGAEECMIAVLGGDTKEAPLLSLCATVIGKVYGRNAWNRASARAGDIICISGPIGAVSAATSCLSYNTLLPTELVDSCRHALAHPQLPLDLAEKLRRYRFRIAATDISDGLGANLHAILDASRLGCIIYGQKIPISKFVKRAAYHLQTEALRFAFGFGGDGQFIFTCASRYKTLVQAAGATIIGKCTTSADRIVVQDGKAFDVPHFGHEDFAGANSSIRLMEEMRRPFSKIDV